MSAKTKRKSKESTALATTQKPGKAIAIRQEGNTPASATATMVALAQSKDFDAAKFKALAEFQAQMVLQQARIDFVNAMLAMQPELPVITATGMIEIPAKKDGAKPQRTPYATWNEINRVIKPILTQFGFVLTHANDALPDGRVVVISRLSRGQHTEESKLVLPIDSSGSKNNVQGVGSAVSYGKRYNTISLLNINSQAPADWDDDATIAGNALMAPIDEKQFEQLQQLIDDTGADVPKLCALFGVEGTKLIRQKDFDTAVRMLSQKSKKKA